MKKIVLAFGLVLAALSFSAQALDQTQKTAIHAAILAEPSIATCVAEGNDGCVTTWLNSPSTFIVWRTRVTAEEYHNSAIVWTAVDALTNGKARIWEWMSRFNNLNPSQVNVRQGFADAFGAASATTTAALVVSKRAATNAEKSLATGTGTNGTPGLLTFEGFVNNTDVAQILRP